MEIVKTIVKGDIFCIEIDKKFKCFFQYIGNDKTNWNRSVIKVFNTRYPYETNINLNDIVNQKNYFWTYAFIDKGVRAEFWYKVGNIKIYDSFDSEDYNFISYTCPKQNTKENLNAPDEHACWWVWKMNEEASQVFPVPYNMIDKLEDDKGHTAEEIIDRIKTGYYKVYSPVYDVIKRKPLPGIQSYLKTQSVPNITYYHFDGEDLVRQISISKTDGSVKINEFETSGNMKFWDKNWESYEFISPKQFEQAWIKHHPKNPINAISAMVSGLFGK